MPQPLCFVIGPIGEEGSDFRQHADDLFDLIIKPVVEAPELGYKADRADKVRKPGHITNQIIKMIKEADLVVADLSHRNPNAFYELALRHALGTPVIHMIRDADAIPFDVTSYRTIKFNLDLRGGERAKTELAQQVRSVKEDGWTAQNPIMDALGIIELEKSEDPGDHAQAVVVQGITELHSQMAKLSARVGLLSDELSSKPLQPTRLHVPENAVRVQLPAGDHLKPYKARANVEKPNFDFELEDPLFAHANIQSNDVK